MEKIYLLIDLKDMKDLRMMFASIIVIALILYVGIVLFSYKHNFIKRYVSQYSSQHHCEIIHMNGSISAHSEQEATLFSYKLIPKVSTSSSYTCDFERSITSERYVVDTSFCIDNGIKKTDRVVDVSNKFTVIMPTMGRDKNMLSKTLNQMKDIPEIHRVLLLWNNQHEKQINMTLPKIPAPIVVIKPPHNSLNNRFLPYAAIETDAVLSLDDDVPINREELMAGFSVWQKNRERLVGPIGRNHRWNKETQSWTYDFSSKSKSFSMVLTGKAFFHKFYLYMYSSWQPQAIRDHVTEGMNCEDIAMNMMIAHLTHKPPIKIASLEDSELCYNCTRGLSGSLGYTEKRNECLNLFAAIYKYMPLGYHYRLWITYRDFALIGLMFFFLFLVCFLAKRGLTR